MESNINKWGYAVKHGAVFIVLLVCLIFTAPAKATEPRVLSEPLNLKNPAQLSFYVYYGYRPYYRPYYYRPYYRPYYYRYRW